ncbi:MAG: fluoride efflux transporter CrcB [Burkholderiales bacterium]
MNFQGVLVVGAGAAVGAWLRWWLGIVLNPLFPAVPLGTLTSNLIAGFLIGVVTELLAEYVALSPEVRLLVITGFLGGLSTFSTFSAEVVALLVRREYWWTAGAISAHVVGSVAMTVAGMLLVRGLFITEAS